MRFAIPILLLLVLDCYAFQAVRTLGRDWSPALRASVYTVYWLMPLALVLWIAGSINGWTDGLGKSTHTVVRTFFFILYFAKLPVVGVLFLDDLRRVFVFVYQRLAGGGGPYMPSRSRFLTQTALVLGSIPFVSLIWGTIRNPYRYKVFRERVKVAGLPTALEGLRIVQISDIHSGSFLLKEPVKESVRLINEQQPDLVFFTGDLVNSTADEIQPFLDVFDKIRAKHGVFSVLGNHDYGDYHDWPNEAAKEANMAALEAAHQQMGWQLLRNQHQLMNINGEQVAVLGVENYSAHLRFPKYGDLAATYAGTEPAALKLLLSHDPSHWEEQVIKNYNDIALTFSGHTHGMQFGVEIPGWIKWSPIKYVYHQWAGLYQRGQQYLYVNRGLGYLGYPGRVGILPEITVVELEAA